MITLKQAIKLLDLDNNDIVYLCFKHCESFAPFYTVRQIKNKFDMKKIKVKKIYPNHFIFSDGQDWEFIISER